MAMEGAIRPSNIPVYGPMRCIHCRVASPCTNLLPADLSQGEKGTRKRFVLFHVNGNLRYGG
jgi:hypothetical protein